ncbi:LamB/YcsF family protein [Solirubrobacter ginsenosidimutans]|uniref:5-oxoprolinase subunit A n=1 Tax=Solirubrobacter ginsenosidimutans TaxID=490573 RepID=A0A9X3N349_9ACTN|nr:5-oxoprolinase subunit PxpA [Solirubrobacter ginsenosidimutans]MDA0166391.1 LamB/YcsF family protein [Solirubrobacter ginsenosidimutans]
MSADRIDLNVDAGESFGAWRMSDDAALFAEVSSANLACGFHAGDPGTIRVALALAIEAKIAVGAHPGLPDLVGFGRRPLTMTPQQVHDDTLYQIGAMYAFTRAAGVELHHMKPHGALNTAVAEASDEHAEAIVAATQAFDDTLPIIAVAGSRLHRAAERLGQPVIAEGFPDRGYAPDGSLAKRGTEGAIIHDAEQAAQRAVRMAKEGTVEALDGTVIELTPGTLCIHGDNPGSVATAKAIRAALEREGITITAF